MTDKEYLEKIAKVIEPDLPLVNTKQEAIAGVLLLGRRLAIIEALIIQWKKERTT